MSLLFDTFWADPLGLSDPFFTPFSRPTANRGLLGAPAWSGDLSLTTPRSGPSGQLAQRGSTDWDAFLRGPKLDITENDKNYVISADLPGVNKSDITVNVQNGMLNIEGHRKDERKEDDPQTKSHYSERTYGSFRRAVRLPADVEPDNISAKMDNGVLTLNIAKNLKSAEGRKEIKLQ
ncbi:Heat shock protein HSP 90-beta [Gaertneriomyces sp. JEL0708]|nr:Heat shock protein HSP 90-beta [Gaertneriomyces sp. JEL0708]